MAATPSPPRSLRPTLSPRCDAPPAQSKRSDSLDSRGGARLPALRRPDRGACVHSGTAARGLLRPEAARRPCCAGSAALICTRGPRRGLLSHREAPRDPPVPGAPCQREPGRECLDATPTTGRSRACTLHLQSKLSTPPESSGRECEASASPHPRPEAAPGRDAMSRAVTTLLRKRGLLAAATSPEVDAVARDWGSGPLAASHPRPGAYIGFDPTASSLHLGSMVQLVALWHLRRAGFKPIALVSVVQAGSFSSECARGPAAPGHWPRPSFVASTRAWLARPPRR